MSPPTTDDLMSEEGRGIVTDREKEVISGDADVTDNYEYKVRSTVRNRIKKRFGDDLEFLEKHFPEAYELVVEIACEDT